MNNALTVNINLDKLQKSSSTINNIQEQISSVDLSDYFMEIEEQIKEINFIHGNCINDYKESIIEIVDELKNIKKEIAELDHSLRITYTEFAKTEKIDNNEINNVLNLYPDTKAKENIYNIMHNATTNISSLTTDINNVENTQESESSINTIPIGLGIAAAGITGAVGAVTINSLTQPKDVQIEPYKEPVSQQEQVTKPVIPQINEKQEEELTPYHAFRNQEELNKFYSDGKPREESSE